MLAIVNRRHREENKITRMKFSLCFPLYYAFLMPSRSLVINLRALRVLRGDIIACG